MVIPGQNGTVQITERHDYNRDELVQTEEVSRKELVASTPEVTTVGTKPAERTETVTREESIEYSRQRIADPEMLIGTERTEEGSNGVKTIVETVRYYHDQEQSRTIQSETILKPTIDEITYYGTKELDVIEDHRQRLT